MNLNIQVKNYRCFSEQHPVRVELRKGVHALVGPNNSGKSSLLKFFYDFRGLFQQLSDPNQVASAITHGAFSFQYPQTITDPDELFFDRNLRNLEITIDVNYAPDEPTATAPRRIIMVVPRGTNRASLEIEVDNQALRGPLELREGNLRKGEVVSLRTGPLQSISKLLASTTYVGPFRNAINIGAAERYFDIQTGEAFIKTWKNFKSGMSKKASEVCRRLELQLARIFGYEDFQINSLANDRDLQIIADGRSYKSADMGAGILQFVIVLANAALFPSCFVLIDEPEIGLHPTLQMDFLTTLAAYAADGLFFATHNLGLARASADRIYSIRRIAGSHASEVRPFESATNLTELLGELGFNAYRDLGFQKVLLVEGPSDVKAVQQFLRHLRKEHEVLLLPLGGAGMINGNIRVQLQEIKRIGAEVFALIDSERPHAGVDVSTDRKEFMQLCREAEIQCCILERRALDNYLTERAIRKVKGEKYSALAHFEKLKDAKQPWAKEENWIIIREMEKVEFEFTDLGKFLASL